MDKTPSATQENLLILQATSRASTLIRGQHQEGSSSNTLPSFAILARSEVTYLKGSGSEDDPYVVGWAEGEAANPYNWTKARKWVITLLVSLGTLCISFASSAYSGAIKQIGAALHVSSSEVLILGISMYILGFGAGPLVWAGASELYGRRLIFLISYLPFTLFHIGGATANNIQTILITRLFAGFFGSAPLTNSGGVIADIWSAEDRGSPSALFSLAGFFGAVLGPIAGGYVALTGWRNVFWIMFAFAAVMYIVSYFFVPETYAPTLLRLKTQRLNQTSIGSVFYVSTYDEANTLTKRQLLKLNLSRPFVLLLKEPIVLLLSTYTALIYGTLYLFFTAFPLVFQTARGWNSGQGGLAFLGVGTGMLIATAMAPLNNKYYMRRQVKSSTGRASPEDRLPFAMFGSILLPIGLFWFAWSSNPSVHWIVPILAGVPFGTGMILVFTSVLGYLIDVYDIYAASALAANAILRSVLGAVFPLFATYMYHNLGNAWASTLVGLLSLACVPMPFVFFYHGERIRAHSTFAPSVTAPKVAPKHVLSRVDDIASRSKEPQVDEGAAHKETDVYAQEYGVQAGMLEQRARDALEKKVTAERLA